jgi:hypothetical protein
MSLSSKRLTAGPVSSRRCSGVGKPTVERLVRYLFRCVTLRKPGSMLAPECRSESMGRLCPGQAGVKPGAALRAVVGVCCLPPVKASRAFPDPCVQVTINLPSGSVMVNKSAQHVTRSALSLGHRRRFRVVGCIWRRLQSNLERGRSSHCIADLAALSLLRELLLRLFSG